MTAIQPARYTCYRAAGPIHIDGRLDEPSWQLAPKSTPFVDIVTGEPAWFDTRVALLWDDDNLYAGFRVEETDVWGTMPERDSKIYEENDVELFIAGENAYYEFEINALNTVYEAFWIWKPFGLPRVIEAGTPVWFLYRRTEMAVCVFSLTIGSDYHLGTSQAVVSQSEPVNKGTAPV